MSINTRKTRRAYH